MAERWQELKALFRAALERAPAERAGFLQTACAGDPALRHEVETLLAAHDTASGFLETPAVAGLATAMADAEDAPRPAITPGLRFGPYEIGELLGSGGMGEVYRARDLRLNRTVAIKVLPTDVRDRADVRQRFEREAQTISSLNHPHICALYDVGQHEGLDFLVMEYLEGETLDERLHRRTRSGERAAPRPLPLDEALQFAIQILDALDKAHRRGIVHRDLKPGNIFLTKDGAKLLDFGLAKWQAPVHAGAPGSSLRETRHGPLTREGTIVGTSGYMAPELLEGKEADFRSDIFAFGAVLYEMIAGSKAFDAESDAGLIAAILERNPPPLSSVQPLAPPILDDLVRKCLAKDPDQRWQSASDLLQALRWVADPARLGGPSQTTASPRGWLDRVGWVAAGVLSILLAGMLTWKLADQRGVSRGGSVVRFQIAPPEATHVRGGFAVSPDGSRIVFTAVDAAGGIRLWLRSLDSVRAQPLSGTEAGFHPFWSPDGESIGFLSTRHLKKLSLRGGAPQILSDVGVGGSFGGTWNSDGVILFCRAGEAGPVLYRVEASGGIPQPVTRLDQRAESGHLWPQFLPDGRRFLYFARSSESGASGMFLGSLDSADRHKVLATDVRGTYAPPGYLLFLREQRLLAQPFDAARGQLHGEAVPVAERVEFSLNAQGLFWASEQVLVYRVPPVSESQVAWVDRAGRQVGSIPLAGYISQFSVSPDFRRVAFARYGAGPMNTSIWLLDLTERAPVQVTFGPGLYSHPLWSPDGTRLVYVSNQGTRWRLHEFRLGAETGERVAGLAQRYATNADEPPIYESPDQLLPTSFSPDGRALMFTAVTPSGGQDVWLLPFAGDRKPVPVVQTPAREDDAVFSPDGRWIAYDTDESGRRDIYVRRFPIDNNRWRISTAGGILPRWRPDGKELFYIGSDLKLVAVAIRTGVGLGFEADTPQQLFPLRIGGGGDLAGQIYGVNPDGQRFLFKLPTDERFASPLSVVLNWRAALAGR